MLSALWFRALRSLAARTITGHDGSPYLTRWTVADFGKARGRIYLHRFHRGDEDRELHNHPWAGVSLILSGGYREERRDGNGIATRAYPPGSVNVILPETFHRVDLLGAEAWTLFATGPVVQSWGFWNRSTCLFTPWREFVAQRGAS